MHRHRRAGGDKPVIRQLRIAVCGHDAMLIRRRTAAAAETGALGSTPSNTPRKLHLNPKRRGNCMERAIQKAGQFLGKRGSETWTCRVGTSCWRWGDCPRRMALHKARGQGHGRHFKPGSNDRKRVTRLAPNPDAGSLPFASAQIGKRAGIMMREKRRQSHLQRRSRLRSGTGCTLKRPSHLPPRRTWR
jgi:hypothetical protein